jgi:HPr kinase/phosphorylase
MRCHGTAIAVAGHGVLLRGAPGSGKSSLALHLIDQPGFGLGHDLLASILIADDQVELTVLNGDVLLSSPPALAGLLEIRGQGIVSCPSVGNVALALVVDLMPTAAIERLPAPESLVTEVGGNLFRRIALDAFAQAAAARLRAALSSTVAPRPPKA